MKPEFIHLRVHSEFSLVDGIVKIQSLVKHLSNFAMPAVALTEQSNLFSLVKFYRATQQQGIKAIMGADVAIFNADEPDKPFCLTLIAQNKTGYITLTELISKSYQHGQRQGVPMIKKQWLAKNQQGLLALSGALEGDIGKAFIAANSKLAEQCAKDWIAIFAHNFFIEVQRVGKPYEEDYINAVVTLATKLEIPVVATNDVRFINKTDFDAHEVRVCINQGNILDDARRPKNYTNQQYLRSPEEMLALFDDLPEALENTVEIAKRCNVQLVLDEHYLPDFPIPKNTTLEKFFMDAARQGLQDRLQQYQITEQTNDTPNQRIYSERLETELGMIIQMGFSGYFMIVADFIQWAKNNAIPVGPGRGSGAGSLVAYALKITDIDPITFDLLFERFLNPERVSMPDFDIDFCMDRRDEVIEYVANHYGKDRVSQIITHGTMAAKAVIRDVGRVLSFAYGFVDSLAKLVPFDLDMTLNKALRESPDLRQRYDTEADVKLLIDMAISLEGICRNAGKHAGGVVIAPRKLTDFSALYCDEEGNNLVTQFDKDDVELVGLVKFDFLGLRTLTIINWTITIINTENKRLGKPLVDIALIPRDDPATYQIFDKCQTTAIFQLESRGIKELIRKLKPDCFDDIVALVALFRPGPLESGMVNDYIKVKHGANAEYAHPLLEPILNPTNGVILYQEQVMQIARELAGYTLGGADMLRRAMGKKKAQEMAKQRTVFIKGAIDNQIKETTAKYVFDLMEKFAGYGFNKSHSVAYALIAYQTAWLKRHYPAEFMVSVMSSDMDNTDKMVTLKEECENMNLIICPPNINTSYYKFTVNEQGEIMYGMGAIKGVGEAAVTDLIDERREHGAFTGLYNLCRRVSLRKVNKRVMEALIKSGAFDSINADRAAHLAELPTAMRVAEQQVKMRQTGQNDLFGLAIVVDTDNTETYTTTVTPWTKQAYLEAEKITLGMYLSGHPIDQYQAELDHIRPTNIASLVSKATTTKKAVRVVGLVVEMRTRQTKKGTMMGFANFDDKTARLEVAAFSKTYQQYRDIFIKDALLVTEGVLSVDNYSGGLRLTAQKIYTFEQAREIFAHCIVIDWQKTANTDGAMTFIKQLKAVLQPFTGGNCPVQLCYYQNNSKASLQLGDDWRIHPTDKVLAHLKKLLSDSAVNVSYR